MKWSLPLKASAHHAVVALQGGGGIAVEGRADFIGDDVEINILRMEHAITIGKVMHELLGLLQFRRFRIAAPAASVQRGGDARQEQQT